MNRGDPVEVVSGKYAGKFGTVVSLFVPGKPGSFEVKLDTGVVVVLQSNWVERYTDGGVMPTTEGTPMQGQGKPDPAASLELQATALYNQCVDDMVIMQHVERLENSIRGYQKLISDARKAISDAGKARARLQGEARKVARLRLSWAGGTAELKSRAGEYAKA